MTKASFIYVLFLGLFGLHFAASDVQGQEAALEQVVIAPDRSVYFAGDHLLYSGSVRSAAQIQSKVLYVELVNDRGYSVLKQKAAIVNGTVQGAIEIPSEIISGRLLFRAYTQFQRNLPPSSWSSHIVTVINPSLSSQRNATPEVEHSSAKALKALTYRQGRLSWELDEPLMAWSFSVVKSGLIVADEMHHNRPVSDAQPLHPSIMPESRATVVKGTVVNANDKSPVANVLVYATVLGEQRQFHVMETNDVGEFAFNFPRLRGEHKVYLCAELNDVQLEYQVENPFDARILEDWKSAPIDSSRWNRWQSAYRHHQMASFADQRWLVIPQNGIEAMPEPFPSPTERVVLSDYIKLQSVEDAIKEIVPQAYTRVELGKRTIHMYDRKTKAAFTHPLVMVDNLPYPDHSVVFDIPINQIERFDIYAEPMIYGDVTIKGVLNIITKDGVLGGLDLPNNGIVIDFQFPEEPVEIALNRGNEATPLLLNTVAFQPFNRNPLPEYISIQNLIPGERYTLIIHGQQKDGAAVHYTGDFTVPAVLPEQ